MLSELSLNASLPRRTFTASLTTVDAILLGLDLRRTMRGGSVNDADGISDIHRYENDHNNPS